MKELDQEGFRELTSLIATMSSGRLSELLVDREQREAFNSFMQEVTEMSLEKYMISERVQNGTIHFVYTNNGHQEKPKLLFTGEGEELRKELLGIRNFNLSRREEVADPNW